MQCQAKNKKTGEQCRRRAVTGKQVCQVHGGVSLSGPASGTFKTGRYSKVLPVRLAARYQEAASDPDLLALREDIALLDSRLADVLGRVDTGEAGSLWRLARDEFATLDAAIKDSDAKALTASMGRLRGLLGKGVSDYAAWGEIGDLLEQRRKLVESERKRLVELQQMMTTEQAMTLVAALGNIIRTHVTDRTTLQAISAELTNLLHKQPRILIDG